MKIRRIVWLGAISSALLQTVLGQDFVNLDFEDATVAPTPVNGFGGSVDPAMAFPGWTVGGGGIYLYVLYNDITLGSPAVALMGPNFPNAIGFTPLQGFYSAWLYYANPSIVPPPTLSQTGLIPADAQSISFLVGEYRGDPAVTLNGVNISLVPISGGRMAGNISTFAGSVAQLTFSTSDDITGDNFLYFDDIQFSTTPIPEPSALSLFNICALFFWWRMKRPNNSPEPTPITHSVPHSRLTVTAARLIFCR